MHFYYNNKINTLLKPFGIRYDGKGAKLITEEIFELLDGYDENLNKERKIVAIERAKRNYNNHQHNNPANEESTTTVYRLVEEILKYT